MTKDPRITFPGVIPAKSTAITIGGGAGDATRTVLDLYIPDDELPKLASLRGERLYVTFVREEDVERLRREP